ncbi:protein Frey 1 isoform X2 [Notamacropus eugenii]|uniref:protein Frey 1 isoform X2 n=1 Tax=Notamacropus eugenii TaxID=9315 RepID=UPI003B675FEE
MDPSAQFLDTSKQCRLRYQPSSIPEELDTMELPNGLVDDYGILPKHPGHQIVHSSLSKSQKRKRDGPDLSEYYYEAQQ